MTHISRRRGAFALASLFGLGAVGAAAFTAGDSVQSQAVPATCDGSASTDPIIHCQAPIGESWNTIAARYGLTGQALARQNGQNSTSPQPLPGVVLHIVRGAPPASTTLPPETTLSPTTTVEPTTTLPPSTTTTSTTVAPTTTSTTTTTTVAPTTTTIPATTTTAPDGVQFLETFDGNGGFDRFNTGVYRRDNVLVAQNQWSGDHDMACGTPATQRTVHRNVLSEVFWMCVDHLMVGEGDTSGYSIAWFSPKETFASVRKVCWSVNLTHLGTRQWWEVAVMPADHTELVAHASVANDAGNTVSIYPNTAYDVAAWSGVSQYKGKLAINGNRLDWNFIDAGNDKATRYPGCFEQIGTNQLRFSLTGPFDGAANDVRTLTHTVSGNFPTNCPCKVVFKNHVYTALKDGPVVGQTWHWDNISVT